MQSFVFFSCNGLYFGSRSPSLSRKKRLGTCYFSIGDNTALGGSSAVGIHIPGVLKSASVWLDDTQILKEGEFILEV